jgi:diaminopimelate decarboxylase
MSASAAPAAAVWGVAPGQSRTRTGELAIGGVLARTLAAAYGTPMLAFDLDVFDAAVRAFTDACAPHGIAIAYAAKAFVCIGIAKRLAATALGIDVCSLGELVTAERGGMPAERITFHGAAKTAAELAAIVEGRVGRVVVDGREELVALAALATPDHPCSVLLRVNAGIEAHTHAFVRTNGEDTKFGFALGALDDAFTVLANAPGLAFEGLHTHVGSQIAESDAYLAALDVLFGAAAQAGERGFAVRTIVVGGGFGVEDRPTERAPLDIPELFAAIAVGARENAARHGVPLPTIGIEPGRALAARAGTSLYTVRAVKVHGRKRFVVVDGGLADNPRPMLYGAVHQPLVAHSAAREALVPATLVGRSCENDEIGATALPADLRPGDLLALCTTGAYVHGMASNYNRFGRGPVAFVENGTHRLAVRGESTDDVLARDVPDA